jgi:glucosamine kinase
MIDSSPPCLIAVDGGGTACRIAILADGTRHEIRVGGANVATDPEGAVARIAEGIARLGAEAGLPRERLAQACLYLGLAGVTDSEAAERVAARFAQPLIRVEDDRAAAVAGALGSADGTVASLGTGSFVARQAGGAMTGLGGWGWLLGDEASGAWLGRRMLGLVLHAVDGLAEHTDLTRALLDDHGGAAGVVAFGFACTPAGFAGIAPLVLEAAAAGDPLARALMAEGAEYVARAARRLGWTAGESLCLMGGIGPRFAPFLPAEMAAAAVPPKGSALDGALALAARLAPEPAP